MAWWAGRQLLLVAISSMEAGRVLPSPAKGLSDDWDSPFGTVQFMEDIAATAQAQPDVSGAGGGPSGEGTRG